MFDVRGAIKSEPEYRADLTRELEALVETGLPERMRAERIDVVLLPDGTETVEKAYFDRLANQPWNTIDPVEKSVAVEYVRRQMVGFRIASEILGIHVISSASPRYTLDRLLDHVHRVGGFVLEERLERPIVFKILERYDVCVFGPTPNELTRRFTDMSKTRVVKMLRSASGSIANDFSSYSSLMLNNVRSVSRKTLIEDYTMARSNKCPVPTVYEHSAFCLTLHASLSSGYEYEFDGKFEPVVENTVYVYVRPRESETSIMSDAYESALEDLKTRLPSSMVVCINFDDTSLPLS
ncbi:hypothetical protein QAD02_001475 [Eretmocerus hayati]|uniref:Uncharacterized protein n=1 Tax=Eretmocerus hayati TaxID=131215 RepID=A0ACC2NH15_9HYME|nr:hypothetical protein QAD02_001475 [Eretmocerus hayati]